MYTIFMIKNILLGIVGLVVVAVAIGVYVAYSKLTSVTNEINSSIETAAESPLIPVTEEIMEEGGRLLEGQTRDSEKLYILYDEYLQILVEEIEVLVELQEQSDRVLCKQVDDVENLSETYEVVQKEFEYIRSLPTGSDAEFSAYLIAMGAVHNQLPLIGMSMSSIRGFCAE